MHPTPFQVLRAAQQRLPVALGKPRLAIVGATGVLGNEVMRRLVGAGMFEHTEVLAREPMTAGLRTATAVMVPSDSPAEWPDGAFDAAVVLFDPPRLFFDRERALWTPRPDQLQEVAAWLRRSGVGTLAVVLPHDQGRLPDALKRGLAGLNEHAVAALGFERLLIVRSARERKAGSGGGLAGVARWMLSVFRYMVPGEEMPVRASRVAEFVACALECAPPGIHVAAPETVWRAARGDLQAVVRDWLRR